MTAMYLKPNFTVRTGLVADPVAKHIRALRQSIWLYLFLLAAVSTAGERLIDPAEVGETMGLSEGTVRSWLGQLRHKGYVACRRSGRHVWVKVVLRWKPDGQSKKNGRLSPNVDTDPVSITAKKLAGLLGEPLESPLVANLVSTYRAEEIRPALDEVLSVPEHRIKKSRLSFLVYLLKKSK
jgi:DNA-binding transcriptional ArsR family regulator